MFKFFFSFSLFSVCNKFVIYVYNYGTICYTVSINSQARRPLPLKHFLFRLVCLVAAFILLFTSAFAYEKLQQGDKDGDVLAMQQALRSLGYSIVPDGSYGAATAKVVKSFQKNHGLKQDGIAGNQTLSLLYSLAPGYAPDDSKDESTAQGNGNQVTTPVTGVFATVQTTGGSLNIRFAANDSSLIIGKVPNQSKVSVSQKGSTWCQITYNGTTGYVMTQYLNFSAAQATASPTPTATPTSAPLPTVPVQSGASTLTAIVTTTGGSLNLRSKPSGGNNIVDTIPNGTMLTISSRGTTWCTTTYNGTYGYVMTKFLTFGSSQTASPSPSPTPSATVPASSSTTFAYVTTTGGSLNLRASANKSAKVLDTIPNGTKLAIIARGATWCATSYNGTYGYVMTSFLRFETVSTPTATPTSTPTATPTAAPTSPIASTGSIAYVTTTGGSLNLREQPRTGTTILDTIPNGTKLVITARGTTWCATSYNGFYGYVMTSFLTFAESPTPSPSPTPTLPPATGTSTYAVVTTSGGTLNLRQTASTSAKVLAQIPNSTTLLVTARGTTWCAVNYAGTSGYVMTSYLTFFTSSVPTATQEPSTEEETDPSKFTRTLRKGMTGTDVAWVQNRLKELGYSTPTNGTYDDDTMAAVKAFQGQNGLTKDGLAGSQTFAILNSPNARRADDAPLSYSTLRIDDTESGVYSMQKALKELGYNLTVNGTFDEATHNAVVAFQQRNGLVISGIADALTQQVIYSGSAKPYSTPVEELPADAGKIAGPSVSQIKLLHWFDEIKPNVSTGQTITVFDPNTSLSWNIRFYSLGRHADSEPLTWRDTQIMNRSFGSTSWTIHPVYVLLPTGQWTVATMHNNPHLYGSINNNGFGGHLCIHFLRDMDECTLNDPNYGVNNQKTLRSAWKALTGETVE